METECVAAEGERARSRLWAVPRTAAARRSRTLSSASGWIALGGRTGSPFAGKAARTRESPLRKGPHTHR